MNWLTAKAKLIDAMPSPVDVLSGDTKRPSDWRIPIVTIRNAAPLKMISQIARGEVAVVMLFLPRKTWRRWYAARNAQALTPRPVWLADRLALLLPFLLLVRPGHATHRVSLARSFWSDVDDAIGTLVCAAAACPFRLRRRRPEFSEQTDPPDHSVSACRHHRHRRAHGRGRTR